MRYCVTIKRSFFLAKFCSSKAVTVTGTLKETEILKVVNLKNGFVTGSNQILI